MAPKKRKAVAAKAEPPSKKAAKVEEKAASVETAGGYGGVIIEAWYVEVGEIASFLASFRIQRRDIILRYRASCVQQILRRV